MKLNVYHTQASLALSLVALFLVCSAQGRNVCMNSSSRLDGKTSFIQSNPMCLISSMSLLSRNLGSPCFTGIYHQDKQMYCVSTYDQQMRGVSTEVSDKQTRDALTGMSDSLTNKCVVYLPFSLTTLTTNMLLVSLSIANRPSLCTS